MMVIIVINEALRNMGLSNGDAKLPPPPASATNRTTNGIPTARGHGSRTFRSAPECLGTHPDFAVVDSRDCLASARRLDRHRPYLQVQKHGRQLQLWLGNGTHRGVARFRARF